jgi:glycosyltransferase involved in cell wall biosynthesis
MAPLHVLVVARWYPSFDDPGRGSFVADHVDALRNAGVDVTVASFDPTGVRGLEASRPERAAAAAVQLEPALRDPAALAIPRGWGAGVPVARLPVILDGSRRGATDVVEAHARALVPFGIAVHVRQPVDIIHAHTGFPDGIAAARVAERIAVPLLTTEHSSTAPDELTDPDANRLYRTLLAHGRRVVAVSGSLAHEIADRLGYEVHEIAVLPNAVPVDRFPPGPAEARDRNELLYVGSRKRTKGIETLLRAFALVRLEEGEARLRLVGAPGTNEDEMAWREMVARLGVAERVVFEDRADREGVAEAMRRAWVFVHASPRETFGMVAVEAIASGLPVAATPSGGVDEIVGRDAGAGEIAHGGDPEALAGAIRRVLVRRDRFDPATMHQRMAAAYAAPAIARRTLELYASLLHEVSPGSGRSVAPRADADGWASAGGGRMETAPTARREAGREEMAARRDTGRPDAGRPPEAGGGGSFEGPLVVGLARDLTSKRLAVLPPELLAGLTIATLAEPEPRTPQPGRWLEHDPEREYFDRLAALGGPLAPTPTGRLVAALRSPRTDMARRDLIARRADVRRESLEAFLRTAWEQAGRPRYVLALDADDVLAAASLGGTGAGDSTPSDSTPGGSTTGDEAASRSSPTEGGPPRAPSLAPGGLRWLVDRWDEAGRPTG